MKKKSVSPVTPSASQPVQPENPLGTIKKSKLLVVVFILLLLEALGLAGYFGYQNYQLKQQVFQNQPSLSTTTSPTPADPTAGWKTYTDENMAISFKIPIDWITNGVVSSGMPIFESPDGNIRVGINWGPKGGITGLDTLENYCSTRHKNGSNLTKNYIQIENLPAVYCVNEDNKDEGLSSVLFMIQREEKQYDFKGSFFDKEHFQENLDTFLQILSTFKFIELENVAQPVVQSVKAVLDPMEGWKNENIGSLTLKLPSQATLEKGICVADYEECYLIKNHDDNLLSPPYISVWIKTYQGGARRQEADLTGSASNYSFKEITFGNNRALEGFFNCQTSQCTSLREIILVVNNKLIHILYGNYRNGSESPTTNAIISTIKASN